MNIGDLVKSRLNNDKVGIVVDKRIANDGLTSSFHARHIINNYPLVYYVYFSGEGKTGPHMESDLVLQQDFKQERASTGAL